MARPGTPPIIGILGGSGVYEIDGLENARWKAVETPFGAPSDELLFGEFEGQQLVFLPRHGRGHKISPTELNFRANIDALKRSGVTEIISVSAVGSLHADLVPGMFVIVDQFIDHTRVRARTFFEKGLVAHVSMADPVCKRLGDSLEHAARLLSLNVRRGGTCIVIEGPQFSTRAESERYRAMGCDVIGMTNMPEAKLAREAEMCYATVAMITDYDCWHPQHDDVTVESIINTLSENAENARSLIRNVAGALRERHESCSAGCHTALDAAVITAPDARDPKAVRKLSAVAGRVLNG